MSLPAEFTPAHERLHGFFLRVYAMAAKETLHIRRDPRTLYMALAMPVVMLLLFGFGIGFDVHENPLLVVDHDGSATSRRLVQAFTENQEFARMDPGTDVNSALRQGKAKAALIVPRDLEKDLLARKDATVQLVVDGVDGNTARFILTKADAIVGAENQGRSGIQVKPPITVQIATLFNPAGNSAWFIVPGLAA